MWALHSARVFRYVSLVFWACLTVSCGGGSGGSSDNSDAGCDGSCARQNLSETDVRAVVSRAVAASQFLGMNATIAVVDRVGNVLAVYQMSGAPSTTTITSAFGAQGGLEGLTVPSTLAAISKAGTGAYLSSQGNAFSTRTASQIIQEHFDPGQLNQPGGPLSGVQFSQLPCSDIKDPTLGPRPLPLGLSADPGGFPLYKGGDLVGGIGVEFDGRYTIDRDIEDVEENAEERVALTGASDFATPEGRRAERITVGGFSLRFADLQSSDIAEFAASLPAVTPQESSFVAVGFFTDGKVRSGSIFGTPPSGIVETVRAGVPAAFPVSGGPRFPTRAGQQISAAEVDAILDSALLTASRTRAAIRRPLNTAARVSIFIVDIDGTPLGFIRSQDAPVFGLDVALQKARTAAFFSSGDSEALLTAAGFGGYVSRAAALNISFDGQYAYSARAIGNLSRPFFPDGIDGTAPGPLSLPFPGTGSGSTWSPFNTGLQLDLAIGGIAAPLSGTIPSSCTNSVFGRRLGNGIQIFSGSVPLYRGGRLIGGIGISGDGIFQDDMVAFYGASRAGLDAVGHRDIGDSILGFNAPPERRSDMVPIPNPENRLRYVNCPESPFIGSKDQNVCGGF